jgi:hypothetical protein
MQTNQNTSLSRLWIAILVLLFVLSLSWLTYINIRAGAVPWEWMTSALLLSLPLGLFYFSLGLLLAAEQRKLNQQALSPRLIKLLYWTPRIAAILITLFVSLFSLDVFGTGAPLREQLLGFLMHSIPALTLALILIFAWRWEWVGFLAYLAAAGFFVLFFYSDPIQAIGNFLVFSGPLLGIALLFGLNWKWHAEIRAAR